jgi:hypothetical protein
LRASLIFWTTQFHTTDFGLVKSLTNTSGNHFPLVLTESHHHVTNQLVHLRVVRRHERHLVFFQDRDQVELPREPVYFGTQEGSLFLPAQFNRLPEDRAVIILASFRLSGILTRLSTTARRQDRRE